MMQNEMKIHRDVSSYGSPGQEKTLASLRMSTCVTPRVVSGHSRNSIPVRNGIENPPSLSIPNTSRNENLNPGRPGFEALELLSKKVSDKNMLHRFQSADTAFMLATGDIFMKSSDVLRNGHPDLNEVSALPKTYSEIPFNENLIPTTKRGMTFNNILQDIAVTNATPRSRQLVTTEISMLDNPTEKIQFGQIPTRSHATQTTRSTFSRSLLSSREADYNNFASNFGLQRTITPPKYPLSTYKNSAKISIHSDDHNYRRFKGSLRRPPSRNKVTVLGKPSENSEKLREFSDPDSKTLLHPTKSPQSKSTGNSMLGVSKAIQQLGLNDKSPTESISPGKVPGVTGISYQSLTAKNPLLMSAGAKENKETQGNGFDRPMLDDTDSMTIATYFGRDEESASVITQDTGVYENDDDAFDEDNLEGEMTEDNGGSQGDFCMDDNDIDCVDDTAIGCLEDDDNATEAEEISESARTSVDLAIGDSKRTSIDEGVMKSALIKSIFSNCPPVINFCTKHEKVEPLPSQIRKLLRWKMSPITPIVVRTTIARSGFKPSKKSHDWIGYFGKHMKASGFRSLKEYQKINHFPGSFQLGRKDRLWRNLSRMQAKFGRKEFGFVPQSYILPWDKKLLKSAWEEGNSKQKYIIKPPASARGIGIRLIHKWNQIPTRKPVLVQKYLSKPLLLNGFKFDIRLYVYVTSFDPLRIYLFDDGLVRFATTKYSTSTKHLSNKYMHLTNYSINKHSGDFQQNDDVNICQGHKWGLKALWRHLQERGVNTDKIWAQMKDIVIKTLISVEQFTNSLVKANCRRKSCCHELFGFDIMLDDRYHPWILEVNISPSLHSNSPLDVEIKGQMVSDMFNIAGFQLPDKRVITANAPSPTSSTTSTSTSSTFSQDKRKESLEVTCDTRSKHTYFARHYKQFTEPELMTMMLDVLTVNDIQMLVESEDENNRRGHFERIFPGGDDTRKYFNYFEQPRYYNALLHMWELKYSGQKQKAVLILESFCRRGLHLLSSVTSSTKAVPMEHVWTMSRQSKIFASPRTDPKYLPIVIKSSASLSSLCSSTSSTVTVPFPGRISSAGKWETSSTKTMSSIVPMTSRSTK